MRKKILFYLVSLLLLAGVLLFFNRIYRELSNYAELSDRHTRILHYFQNLSTQLKSAAVLHPDLYNSADSLHTNKLFFTDSTVILEQLDQLKATVRDSVNIRLTAELDPLIRSELSWLLNSNVPDSIIQRKSPDHLAAFVRIDSLITLGVERTNVLVALRKKQLNDEITTARSWVISFVILTTLLFIYITLNLFKQQSKRKGKEAELETVLNRISDGVVSIDNHWRYTFLNDAALATHPLGKKETLGKSIWEVHPDMKGTLFWDKYHEAMETKKVVEVETYYKPMDTWFSAKVYPSGDGLTIFYKNITQTKKAEQQLSQTIKEVTDYKFALDEASIVAITDQKGIIRHANENFSKISKYTAAELIGQDHRIINSGHHPKEFIRNLWTTVASGNIWRGELKNKAKDGTIYWVDTTIVPFLNEKGKPYQYIAIRSDITQRKEAENLLIKSEKIYKTIASSIPGSVICLLDPEYRYMLIEGEMLSSLGYSKHKLLGHKAADVLPEEVFKDLQPYFIKAFAGETVTRESTLNGYDIISRFIPLKDENNAVYSIMVVAIDITELKKSQYAIVELNHDLENKITERTVQLNKSNEDLEAFSYSVSHDLRAPLRGIIGFTAILEDDYGPKLDEEGKRITSVIKGNALRMGQLIDDLLAFSRLGKQGITKTRVDTKRLLQEILNDLLQQGKNNDTITWQLHVLPEVNADISMIRQVWVNLISNAIKYSSTRENPVIEIGAEPGGDQTVFYVKDNGVGFDEAYKNKLFKVFQRLHDAEEFEGTGVGLALVEKIISRHGGQVWAQGKEGQGACFYFSLPF